MRPCRSSFRRQWYVPQQRRPWFSAGTPHYISQTTRCHPKSIHDALEMLNLHSKTSGNENQHNQGLETVSRTSSGTTTPPPLLHSHNIFGATEAHAANPSPGLEHFRSGQVMSGYGGVGLAGGRSRNVVSSLLWCSSIHYSISVNLSASALFFSCASNVIEHASQ